MREEEAEPVLLVRDLTVHYFTLRGVVRAVDRVSLDVYPGELLAIVGESGSGKSTLGLALMRLIPPPGKIVSGSVVLDGVDLMKLDEESMRRFRGSKISIVFQDPFTTIDPLRRVLDQFVEFLVEHGIDSERARERAVEYLTRVGLSKIHINSYPHQLSGGQKQRVAIAMALSLNPLVVIADEPTTALDVVSQRQVLDLIDELRKEFRTSFILITHDISIAIERADRIGVMYAGQLIEIGDKKSIVEKPLHPYTQGLIASIPRPDLREIPKSIPGYPPDLTNPPRGCRFHPRCPFAMDVCRIREPDERIVDRGRIVKCFLYGEDIGRNGFSR
ncbi:MAG: ABC transporter ATP-binding protein [Sulfolobales archaeon]